MPRPAITSLLLGALLWNGGCGSNPPPVPSATPKATPDAIADEDAHDHPQAGPNGGKLIELGKNEAYHAEWIGDDESGRVQVFVLDGTAKVEVPIRATPPIVIAVKMEDEELEYQLEAVKPIGDPALTAQFEIVNKQLVTLLRQIGHGVTAHLTADIENQIYSGEFPHDHAHHH
ncbi:MAG: hypothetical protein CMJ59_17335 [Planctomycetaceae bacterium]|nr:hypothetical protein [Planctomycetaceae bacterium]